MGRGCWDALGDSYNLNSHLPFRERNFISSGTTRFAPVLRSSFARRTPYPWSAAELLQFPADRKNESVRRLQRSRADEPDFAPEQFGCSPVASSARAHP